MQDDNILKLHEALFIIADEIKRICNKYNIKYFLIAGSMLGAIRHKDIIPWDDDFDIGMLRHDYERFINIAQSELNSKFCLCNSCTEKNNGISFTKIRANNTLFWEEENPAGINSGIFVDIFPIDKIPNSAILRFIHDKLNVIFTNSLLYKCGYKTNINNILYHKMFSFVAYLYPKDRIVKRLHCIQTFFNKSDRKLFYANLCGGYKYGREIFDEQCFNGNLEEYPVGSRKYCLPYYPEKCLCDLYGDYTVLPPIEKRVFKHTQFDIDYGDLLNP